MTLIVVAAIAVALAVLVVYLIARDRILFVREDETFMTRNWRDFRRGLKPGLRIPFDPSESVIKGSKEPKFSYPTLDDEDKLVSGHLRQARTGATELGPQICVPRPFIANTTEPRYMLVTAYVEFSVDFEKLKMIHERGKTFGFALVKRIENAFRDEIAKRTDERLNGERKQVQEEVVKRLRAAELGNQGEEPLGLKFHGATFKYLEERRKSDFVHEDQDQRAGSGASPTMGVAFLETRDYDVIGGAFQHSPEDRTRGLLAILEMQTRRDVAEALAKSGKLVVVTAQELGLMGTALGLDALRDRGSDTDPVKTPKPPAA